MKIRIVGILAMLLVLGVLFVATSENSTSENPENAVPYGTVEGAESAPAPTETPAPDGNKNFNL